MGTGLAMTRAAIWALALLALAGCETARDPGGTTISGLLRQRVAQIGQPPAPPAALPTAAVLASRTDPLLAVGIPSRDARATLTPAARNAGTVTWLATDGITVTTRAGLVVATRGLGHDLMSADVAGALAALAGGGGRYSRIHYTLSDENRTLARRLDCELRPAGTETVDRVDRRSVTRVWAETCTAGDAGIGRSDAPAGAGERIVNRYWVGGAGAVVRSQQWLTPQVGAVTTLLLGN